MQRTKYKILSSRSSSTYNSDQCRVQWTLVSMRPARPNVLYALADDIAPGAYSPYNDRSLLSTPNIAEVARHGLTFDAAYSETSVCAPSRYSLLTGNHAYRGRRSCGVWDYPAPSQIMPGQMTLGGLLQAAGYATYFVGKVHLGGGMGERSPAQPERAPGGPLAHGFNGSYVLMRGHQTDRPSGGPYIFMSDDRDRVLPSGGGAPIAEFTACDAEPGDSPLPRRNWTSTVGSCLARRASAMIASTALPFFLFYSSNAAHGPYYPPEKFEDGTPVLGASQLGPEADMIVEFDRALGSLLRAVVARQLLASTLVVVTSDKYQQQPCSALEPCALSPSLTCHVLSPVMSSPSSPLFPPLLSPARHSNPVLASGGGCPASHIRTAGARGQGPGASVTNVSHWQAIKRTSSYCPPWRRSSDGALHRMHGVMRGYKGTPYEGGGCGSTWFDLIWLGLAWLG